MAQPERSEEHRALVANRRFLLVASVVLAVVWVGLIAVVLARGGDVSTWNVVLALAWVVVVPVAYVQYRRARDAEDRA